MAKQKNKTATATLLFFGFLVVLESALGGVSGPVIKIAMDSIPIFYLLALRFTVASAAFLLLFGRRLYKSLLTTRVKPILVISFFTASGFILSNLALMYTSATNTGFLYSLAVVFTPFVARIILKTKFNFKILPIIVVVSVGLYLLCGGLSFSFGAGEIMALSCAVLSAFNMTFTTKYLEDTDWVVLSFFQVFSSMVVCWPLAIGFDQIVPLGAVPQSALWSVLFLGVASSFLLFILQNLALQKLPTTFVALILCSESVFSAVFANLMLGEQLNTAGYVGAGIILLGIVLATLITSGEIVPQPVEP